MNKKFNYKIDLTTQVIIILMAIFISSCAISRKSTDTISFVEINYGLFNSTLTNYEKNPTSPSGQSRLADNNGFYETTTDVPMRLDIEFGIEFMIESSVKKSVDIIIVLTYPKPIVNEKGQIFKEYKSYRTIQTNNKNWTGYILNKEYELVSGIWNYEIFSNGKLLYTKQFNIK